MGDRGRWSGRDGGTRKKTKMASSRPDRGKCRRRYMRAEKKNGDLKSPLHKGGKKAMNRGEGQPARGLTTAARKTTTPEKSSQMAKTKGRFTIISKGGGGGSSIIAEPSICVVTAAASVPFSLTSTKSFCITPIR